MERNRVNTVIVSAAVGAFVAAAIVAAFSALLAMGGLESVELSGGRSRPHFVVGAGAMWFLSVIVGALGGIVVALVAAAIGRARKPDVATFPMRGLLSIAAATGAILVYVGLRLGVAASGDIIAGTVDVSVFRLLVTAALIGVGAGATIGWMSHALVNPAFLGLEGAAWPDSRAAFMKASMQAMGAPFVAILGVLIIAVPLSQILLTAAHEIELGAVIVGSIVAVLILGVAAALAYRPWDKAGTNA